MSLANEAAYLYTYSKKLMSINSQLKKLSKKAEKNLSKHHKTDDYAKKEKQYFKHLSKKTEIQKLIKEHNQIVSRMKHHEVAFTHLLRKEHSIKHK